MRSILIHAWTVHKKNNKYYLPYTHWIYLKEIVKYYDKVCLLSPVKIITENSLRSDDCYGIEVFNNVEIYTLPFADGYIASTRYFLHYLIAYYKLSTHTVSYVRYPVPFGWFAKIFMNNKKRIIHYVGDPVDAAKNNPVFHKMKKNLLVFFFKPENFLYSWACKGASVYTNGYHIAGRLKKQGIEAKAIISSTLNQNDFHFDSNKRISDRPAIIYIGYLRKAKGVETIIHSFALLQQKYPNAKLTIVGSGEFEQELRLLASKTQNIDFVGHVDDRNILNTLLRSHDLFCFASLSEGSPRVILEAMANSINVVTTPVGSLPYIFKDEENILFADYNDAKMFCDKMIYLIKNEDIASLLRKNAFYLVQNYTIENFLKEIFYEA